MKAAIPIADAEQRVYNYSSAPASAPRRGRMRRGRAVPGRPAEGRLKNARHFGRRQVFPDLQSLFPIRQEDTSKGDSFPSSRLKLSRKTHGGIIPPPVPGIKGPPLERIVTVLSRSQPIYAAPSSLCWSKSSTERISAPKARSFSTIFS